MSHQYNLPSIDSECNSIVVPNTNNPAKAVEYINSYMEKTHCEKLNVDISFMNVIDACYVTTMCSALHFLNFPSGKINWFVSSDNVKKYTNSMSLGNCEYFKL